jgi:hypothetical protein
MADESSNRDLWLAQIKQKVHDEVGDNKWSEDSWTEFVKEVAWWLHNELSKNERDTIEAAAGLIKYRIEKKDELTFVAGSPPNMENFRVALKSEGVPPIVCDILFHKYVLCNSETVAVAGPPVVVAPPSTPRSKDISNLVASVFEGEVNAYLENNFQSVLPQCGFSKFKNREIDDGDVALEIDSFAYMTSDTLHPPKIDHALGIYVVRPNGMRKMKPKGAPRKLAHSHGAVAANLVRTAEKYVVGESYSGDREERIKGKVKQLEEKLEKMIQRHVSQSGGAPPDVTSLFGAAILSFTCQASPRKEQSKKCMKAVLEGLSSASTPILWRLAQAERLFIVVLSTSEGASTCAFREIARGMNNVEISIDSGLATVLERLDEMNERLDVMKKGPGKESTEEEEHKY